MSYPTRRATPANRTRRTAPRRAPGTDNSAGRHRGGIHQQNRLFIIAGLAATILTGCAHQPSPATSTHTATSTSAANQEALTAYQNMWQAYTKAGLTADPNDPDLARHASADALNNLKTALKLYHEKGEIIRGQLTTQPRITPAPPTSQSTSTVVFITDCLDDSKVTIYNQKTGKPETNEPNPAGGRRATTATVDKASDGNWKVATFDVKNPNTC